MKKIYKSSLISDSITLAWNNDKTIDCLYLGFTNATALSAEFYYGNGSLIETISLSAADLGNIFPAVPGIRSAIIYLTAPSGVVFLGTIGIGLSYSMPDPLADWVDSLLDNSAKTRSKDGQVLLNKIPPLRKLLCNFQVDDYGVYAEIKNLVAGVSAPIFCDPFELAHAKYSPFYADLDGSFQNPAKGDHIFTFSLSFVEAR